MKRVMIVFALICLCLRVSVDAQDENLIEVLYITTYAPLEQTVLWQIDLQNNMRQPLMSLPYRDERTAIEALSPAEYALLGEAVDASGFDVNPATLIATRSITDMWDMGNNQLLLRIDYLVVGNIIQEFYGFRELVLFDRNSPDDLRVIARIDYHDHEQRFDCEFDRIYLLDIHDIVVHPQTQQIPVTFQPDRYCTPTETLFYTQLIQYDSTSVTITDLLRTMNWRFSPDGNHASYINFAYDADTAHYAIALNVVETANVENPLPLAMQENYTRQPTGFAVGPAWLDNETLVFQWYDPTTLSRNVYVRTITDRATESTILVGDVAGGDDFYYVDGMIVGYVRYAYCQCLRLYALDDLTEPSAMIDVAGMGLLAYNRQAMLFRSSDEFFVFTPTDGLTTLTSDALLFDYRIGTVALPMDG